MSLNCAVKKITGPRGTSVILTDSQAGAKRRNRMCLSREIESSFRQSEAGSGTETGKLAVFRDDVDKIGYIRITSFSGETVDDFETVLKALRTKVSKPWSWICVSTRGGFWTAPSRSRHVHFRRIDCQHAAPDRPAPTANMPATAGPTRLYPLVVLINSGSASASEIVAGPLGTSCISVPSSWAHELMGREAFSRSLLSRRRGSVEVIP